MPDSLAMRIAAQPSRPFFGKRRRTPGARSVLGIFAVVLLNLVLQPCALALEGGGDCPNCPPATAHGGMSQHGGAEASASFDIPCATTGFDCMVAGDYSHDGRNGHLTPKDAPDKGPAAIIQTSLELPNEARLILQNFDRYTLSIPGTAPPLNVLYCVYLK